MLAIRREMPSNSIGAYSFISRFLFSLLILSISCEKSIAMANTLGGVRNCPDSEENSVQHEELGRFAVEEHNKKENALVEFLRVVEAKEQVVAGTLHHLTIEAIDAGKKKIYEAKVWVKPWLSYKELQEFTHKGDSTSFTTSDLGVKREGHEPGWREVPVHDPVVKDAASHAVSIIQQRSNSLLPYELVDVIHAKAEVIEDTAKFHMLLKLKRGNKEEKFHAEVHKSVEGTYVLHQVHQEENSDPTTQ
ncbi:Cysteine proteinase inhibitor 12 [Carex littledalei]|uniref:Cysteine proteinase inhibitor n=1 Tax=Carex littledalei TaxID=544730 RepID=A0A833QCM2_9POAL|nr:Cysteine proteinase inhibitor 12 [Carex littledalei]